MSLLSRSRSARVALWMGLGTAAAFTAPGCLFPEYSFNEPEGSGASTSTSSNNGGGSPTGGGGGNNPENCTNGVDDDGDGAADCADVKCTEYACVSEVPAGWTGYFALYDGDPAGDPGCPGSFPSSTTPPYVGTNGISAPAATCACSCGNPSWTAGCAPLDSIVIATGDAACGDNTYCSGQAQIPAGWNGTCYNQGYFPGGQLTCGPNTEPTCDVATGDPCNVSVRATAIAATGQGTCQPNPVAVMLPDPVWAQLGRACGDAPV
ncbi:MAG TPA: hypothetical protein VLS89_06115, partial [Candidatus Nanopelagicales bacterium]|nr:hypothetical protein [Candidatus Nanopelagicales bacterium]